jgi:hypothetical protein
LLLNYPKALQKEIGFNPFPEKAGSSFSGLMGRWLHGSIKPGDRVNLY